MALGFAIFGVGGGSKTDVLFVMSVYLFNTGLSILIKAAACERSDMIV